MHPLEAMKRLNGKVALVTGGAKGIGAATAKRLHAEGAFVAILDVDRTGAHHVIDDRCLFLCVDVTDVGAVAQAVDEVVDRFGEIEILVNNAGIQHYGTVLTTTVEDWDQVMNVNLKSAFVCARSVIPSMQRHGRGIVVNVASVQSLHSQQNVAPYTTSKTAMLGLTRSIAVDFAPGIRSVAVCPGTVDTPMVQWTAEQSGDAAALYDEVAAMHLTNRIAKPEEIAGLIAYLCTEEAAFITGQAIRIDGGLGVLLGGTVRA